MSLSLYRKYRPETFDTVLGQDHVVHALQSALKSGNLSHAYLFAGSRGTGKTSIARIFARELGTSPSDIYEIDAASNNSVDQIRELVEGVSTLPFDSKYKVYILDEVHMLSKSAFNALLKTLEEPPAHVIFILATTELHKVLDTVKSRCQVFEFKKPTIEILSNLIQDVAKKENRKIEKRAADMIAKIGDGAFRDTLGSLERILSAIPEKEEVTFDALVKLTRLPTTTFVNEIIQDMIDKNLEKILEKINKHFTDRSVDIYEHFLEFLIERVRIVILYRYAKPFAIELAESMDREFQDDLLIKWGSESNIINSNLLVELINVLGEIKKSPIKTIPLELALIRILGNNEPQKAL